MWPTPNRVWWVYLVSSKYALRALCLDQYFSSFPLALCFMALGSINAKYYTAMLSRFGFKFSYLCIHIFANGSCACKSEIYSTDLNFRRRSHWLTLCVGIAGYFTFECSHFSDAAICGAATRAIELQAKPTQKDKTKKHCHKTFRRVQ